MPILEPVVLEGRGYTVRHIGPKTILWPNANPSVTTAAFVLLNQPTMAARELPMSNIPNSPDMVSGSWTGRINDAGEFSLSFPNKESSDGTAWRNRFGSDGKNQWIEIRNDAYLEFAGCIEVVDLKRDQIVISGHDGFFQLKSAYERDWTCVQAPHDVIERCTQVWQNVISDDFSYDGSSTPNVQWTVTNAGGGTSVLGTSGGLNMSVTSTLFSSTALNATVAVASGTQIWAAEVDLQETDLATTNNAFLFEVTESSGDTYGIELITSTNPATPPQLQFLAPPQTGIGPTIVDTFQTPSTLDNSLSIESDGEWVSAFYNGQLFSQVRRLSTSTSSLQLTLQLIDNATIASKVVVLQTSLESQQPFLGNRGGSTDKGDYVLPSTKDFTVGTVQTYPYGGLHARYYNDLDLQRDQFRAIKILAPKRSQAYAGSGSPEYANQQDDTLSGQTNPLPGAATVHWSAVWFGSVYLKLSAGDYSFSFNQTLGATVNIRVWIGKTKFGDQLIDQWGYLFGGTGFPLVINLSSATLAGTPSYNGTPVLRDGYYPIKVEYAVDNLVFGAPTMKFTPPASYTDPGGTALTGGVQVTVPSTSLSPLGMVDQRNQGISHFDLAQRTAQAFGYQIAVEPKSLESNMFPGVMMPRIREGQDYDTILEPDDKATIEGFVDYGNKLDATDICTSLFGNGAGFQNGTSGQLQSRVIDHQHVVDALFDIQAWQDFSDASYASLLQALLNSQLGLRLDPWQVIAGNPMGRRRLANIWPLPSTLAQMNWRPGDGIRARARDVGIEDTSPRQLLLVTRQIHPNGTTGTQVGFASRPRSSQFALKQALFQASRWQRNYQRQLTTLQTDLSQFVSNNIAPGGFTGFGSIALSPGDQIVRANIRIPVISPTGNSCSIEVNGTIVDSILSGPWSIAPINLDITPVCTTTTASLDRIYVRLKNISGVNLSLQFQLLIDVLR